MHVVVKLFDEVALMNELKDDTIALIHATLIITPIKKLVDAHEIINLNLVIEQKFEEYEEPPWDLPALSDLGRIRRELVLYHRPDFSPAKLIDSYSTKMIQLFHHIQTRKRLTKDVLNIGSS